MLAVLSGCFSLAHVLGTEDLTIGGVACCSIWQSRDYITGLQIDHVPRSLVYATNWSLSHIPERVWVSTQLSSLQVDSETVKGSAA